MEKNIKERISAALTLGAVIAISVAPFCAFISADAAIIVFSAGMLSGLSAVGLIG